MTVEPRTEAGKVYVGGSLAEALERWGVDYSIRTVVLEIESEARAAALREVAERIELAQEPVPVFPDGRLDRVGYGAGYHDGIEEALAILRAILTEATDTSAVGASE